MLIFKLKHFDKSENLEISRMIASHVHLLDTIVSRCGADQLRVLTSFSCTANLFRKRYNRFHRFSKVEHDGL